MVHVGGREQDRRLLLFPDQTGQRLADFATQGERRLAQAHGHELGVGAQDLQERELDLERVLAAVRLGVFLEARSELEEPIGDTAREGDVAERGPPGGGRVESRRSAAAGVVGTEDHGRPGKEQARIDGARDRPGIDVSSVRDDRADRGGSSRSDRQESLDMTLQSLGICVVELPRHGWMANSHPAIVSRTGSV